MKDMKIDIYAENGNYLKSYNVHSEQGFDNVTEITIYDAEETIKCEIK